MDLRRATLWRTKEDSDRILFEACYHGNIGIVKMFRDFNIRNNEYKTPLIEAAYMHNIELVEFILTQDIDVNAIDCDHATALHFTLGNSDMTKLLLENDMIPNSKARNNYTPFIACVVKITNAYRRLDVLKAESLEVVKKLYLEEYSRYIFTIRSILKYLGLENIYYITRQIMEPEVSDDQIMNIVYQ